jgi:two-component system, OmpR family, sensor histidine kinase BaeS
LGKPRDARQNLTAGRAKRAEHFVPPQQRTVATVSVTDTGGGIAPEHLPHVFERFYKVDASRAAESTGSGLGLSITKAIIERHGGTIHVTSQPGRTTFTILLPQSSAS